MLSGTGGGGGLCTKSVWYSFADYSPGKAYTAKCGALGFGVAGTVGRATGLELCHFGDRFAGGILPIFVTESLHMVETTITSFACPTVTFDTTSLDCGSAFSPLGRLDSNHQSSMQRACSQAYRLWRVLLAHP